MSPVSVRFGEFLLACAEEDPGVILRFRETWGQDVFSRMEELAVGHQGNVPEELGISYGFDTALLNMALDQYRKDGDSAAFRVATTNAAMQFARGNGLRPDPELFFSATLLVLGFVPVAGTAIDGYQLYYDVQAGDWVAAGVDSVSLVASMIPIAGGGLRLLLRGSSRFIEVSGDGARVIRATNKTVVPDGWRPISGVGAQANTPRGFTSYATPDGTIVHVSSPGLRYGHGNKF